VNIELQIGWVLPAENTVEPAAKVSSVRVENVPADRSTDCTILSVKRKAVRVFVEVAVCRAAPRVLSTAEAELLTLRCPKRF
jgi:hypothetical protein